MKAEDIIEKAPLVQLRKIQIILNDVNSNLCANILELIEVTVVTSFACDVLKKEDVSADSIDSILEIDTLSDNILCNLDIISNQIRNITSALSISTESENNLN